MDGETDREHKVGKVVVNLEGINKVNKGNVDFLFSEIKKSTNVDDLLHNITKCNEMMVGLNLFEGFPTVKLSKFNNSDIIVNYNLKEKKNNYVVGTNVNNKGEITADFEISIPYILKTINCVEFKANISSIYSNNIAIRFLMPYINFLKGYKIILENNISTINNTHSIPYSMITHSLKTYIQKNKHKIIWEINFNKLHHKINKNYIPSDRILNLKDNHIKNSLKYIYKNNKLGYLTREKENNNEDIIQKYVPYPTYGYYYEMENEISLPFCECKYAKNHFNFLYVKKIKKNLFSYIQFSNGIKYDYNVTRPYYFSNFNFTGSIGSSLIFRGFEHNSIGNKDINYHFNKKKKMYNIVYNYIGDNFFTNFQILIKYIFNFKNLNPIFFCYLQFGRLSNNLFSSFTKIKKDIRISTGIGIMTYIQKNISLEFFLNYPIIYHLTDRTKYFQVGLNFKAVL
ncbi:sorting assembly machinery 50 kDa subunit, putative [Plasmodium ovale]|uniref:Sorting assembly machinery 50 kDa subunit, putative n=2 Tax=Plasmodium ovale TaxID=36330 RepID=A0A1C3KUH8_PLAOA|nr:sorting assembly machinery 50 kDa subunit, putative [Plasmodium ovale]